MKKIHALWQFGRGSRTVPGVSLRKRSILCDLVIAGASLFYFGPGYALAQDINSGLAGYWPSSDINDNMLEDYSGNGHNGSFTGHPIWTVGKLTGALRFDGQTEYVTANNVVNTSQSFTDGGRDLSQYTGLSLHQPVPSSAPDRPRAGLYRER